MSKLRFKDGVTIDTSGELRTLQLNDGWYVIGKGYCIPVKDEQAAKQEIKRLTKTLQQ
jgi:hypothetical protein